MVSHEDCLMKELVDFGFYGNDISTLMKKKLDDILSRNMQQEENLKK